MDFIKRFADQNLTERMFKGKILILYGARQVGKTTLVREILRSHGEEGLYLNCDEIDIRASLENVTSSEIQALVGNKKLVVIDEAQRVPDIGITLKLFADNFPHVQVIATGSSAFELSSHTAEPLTGRKYEQQLYPIAVSELAATESQRTAHRLLDRHLVLGMYPEVLREDQQTAIEYIKEVAGSYLYKDILAFHRLKNPETLERLLQALALQVGSEVSYNELGKILGIDKNTVASYIRILEQAFVIFRIPPFARNRRNEIKKLRKIYFFDNGIRNALINNFNPLHMRQDTGALWENFLFSERLKRNTYGGHGAKMYFWRAHHTGEIDCIEEKNGNIQGFEFKYSDERFRIPKAFTDAYPGVSVSVVSKTSYWDFITPCPNA